MECVKLSTLRLVAGRQKTTCSTVGVTSLHSDCLSLMLNIVDDDSPPSLSVSQSDGPNKLHLQEIISNKWLLKVKLTLEGQRNP